MQENCITCLSEAFFKPGKSELTSVTISSPLSIHCFPQALVLLLRPGLRVWSEYLTPVKELVAG